MKRIPAGERGRVSFDVLVRVVGKNSCQSCRPIFYFVPEEALGARATLMSQAENEVCYSGLRMESAVFRIKTIYRNYRRARFIEFNHTVSTSCPLFVLLPPRGGGNARFSL